MKQIVLFLCLVVCVAIATFLFAPMAFKSRVECAIVSYATRDLNAKVSYDDLSLSFIRSFPLVCVSLENLCVTNNGEWEDDTLAKVGEGRLEMDLRGVLKSDYRVRELLLEDADVRLMINEDGVANWNIVKEKNDEEKETNDGGTDLRLMLDRLEIEDGKLSYFDKRNGEGVRVGHLDSKLEGAWSQEMTDVKTENEWRDCDVIMGGVEWLSGGDIDLRAEFRADLSNEKYDLKDSYVRLNEVKMGLVGTVTHDGEDWVTDIRLKTEEVAMRDLLSLVPALYTRDFEDLRADGKVKMDGTIEGRWNAEKGIGPRYNAVLDVREGWFKYEKLPKRVEGIEFSLTADGDFTDVDKTKIEVRHGGLRMGGSAFAFEMKAERPMTLKAVDLKAHGNVDLGELRDYVPMGDETLTGRVTLDMKARGNYRDYEKGAYDRFALDGVFDLRGGRWKRGDGSTLYVDNCRLLTVDGGVSVEDLSVRTGGSDLRARGRADNVLSWLLRGETLKGSLTTHSKRLRKADLMGGTEKSSSEKREEEGVITLPEDVDIMMVWTIEEAEVDEMRLEDVRGSLHLKGGKACLRGAQLKTMGGELTLDMDYEPESAQRARMSGSARISDVRYAEAFRQMESTRKLLPIFGKTQGTFSGTMDFDTELEDGMNPNLNTLRASGTLESRDVTVSGVEALHKLSKVLKRSELYDPEIKDVKIPYEIKDGKVMTGKFSFYIADTKIMVDEGTTGLDERIDYTLHVDVPTSGSTLFKMSKMGVHMGGTFARPEVTVRSRELVEDAKRTLKENVARTTESVKEDMKDEWREQKEEMKESLSESKEDVKAGLREAKEEIKQAWKGLFK